MEFKSHERLTIVTRGDGGKWSYYYNDQGAIIQIIDPYAGCTAYKLNDEGKVAEEIDPQGNVALIEYDSRGNPIGKIDSLGHAIPLEGGPDDNYELNHWEGRSAREWEYGCRSSHLK